MARKKSDAGIDVAEDPELAAWRMAIHGRMQEVLGLGLVRGKDGWSKLVTDNRSHVSTIMNRLKNKGWAGTAGSLASLRDLAAAAGVSDEWLLHGRGEMRVATVPAQASAPSPEWPALLQRAALEAPHALLQALTIMFAEAKDAHDLFAARFLLTTSYGHASRDMVTAPEWLTMGRNAAKRERSPKAGVDSLFGHGATALVDDER